MKETDRIAKARKKALERMDKILDVYEMPDFVDVTGKSGGDIIVMRIYDSGHICEK